MAAWDTTTGIAALRSLLGDGDADKYEFRGAVVPNPDGITTRFFTGHTLVVPDTLELYLQGVLTAPSGTPDYETGTFSLSPAPSGELQASYYYQWFKDEDLAVFLDDAAQMLSFFEDDDISGFVTMLEAGGVRPSLLQFAAFNAYMRKAAEWADSLEGSDPGGLSIDTTKRHPNWKALADAAYKAGEAKLKAYTDNPLNTSRVAIRFVAYSMPNYQGR
jgi:hypothetical protein